MKIGFFKFSSVQYVGGLENYFITTAARLSDIYPDAEIGIITLSDWYREKLLCLLSIYYLKRKKDISLHRIETEDFKKRIEKVEYIQANSFQSLKRELQKNDVIYAKNEILELMALKCIGYKNLPPVIVGVHTPIHYPQVRSIHSRLHNLLYDGIVYKFLLKEVKLIHVLNNNTEILVKNNFKIPVKKIYNPFEMKFCNEELELNMKFNFDINKTNVVFAGKIIEQKGIYDLKKIIQKVDKDVQYKNKIMFHICGEGNLRHIILDLCKSVQCAKYYGYVEDAELRVILKSADLFISPAKWESLPYNIIEAQSVGLPVIAYDIPGPQDIIVNSKTGILVKNIDEFLRVIYNFSDGRYKFEDISKNVSEKFDPDRIYNELFKMLADNAK